MDATSLEAFFEGITLQAVTDTAEKLLRNPFGFHGDTGIRDFLYARLHVHGGARLDWGDDRPGCSTLLLQAEHYTSAHYRNSGETAKPGRFDLALCAPPTGTDGGAHHAENLQALFAFELGRDKELNKLIDQGVARHDGDAPETGDITKLYLELRDHSQRQGWTIQYFDSRIAGARVIREALRICGELSPLPHGKRLRVVFVEYSPEELCHHLSSNDAELQETLSRALDERGVRVKPEPLRRSRQTSGRRSEGRGSPASAQRSGGKGWATATVASASVEQVFDGAASLAVRLISLSRMEERGRSSGYVKLCIGEKAVAQLHPAQGGVALVLRSRTPDPPPTAFVEVPVSSLAGCRGTNKSWLEGTDRFLAKGPAVAFLIPSSVEPLPETDHAWVDLDRLLHHARALK
jgi:hypothetical protein